MTTPVHPIDPIAEYITTLDITVVITRAGKTYQAMDSVTISRTSGGRTDYTLSAGAVTFSGDGGGVDATTTIDLFNELSLEAVRAGIVGLYAPCPANCAAPPTSYVYVEGCVQRSGTGTGTSFTPCTPVVFAHREYNYCCPSGTGSPQITAGTKVGITCTPPCEATCPIS